MPWVRQLAKVKHPPLREAPKNNQADKQPPSSETGPIQEKYWPHPCGRQFLSPTFVTPKRKSTRLSHLGQTVW
jgi:hypothetical protein